jgi:hypothetical protein
MDCGRNPRLGKAQRPEIRNGELPRALEGHGAVIHGTRSLTPSLGRRSWDCRLGRGRIRFVGQQKPLLRLRRVGLRMRSMLAVAPGGEPEDPIAVLAADVAADSVECRHEEGNRRLKEIGSDHLE